MELSDIGWWSIEKQTKKIFYSSIELVLLHLILLHRSHLNRINRMKNHSVPKDSFNIKPIRTWHGFWYKYFVCWQIFVTATRRIMKPTRITLMNSDSFRFRSESSAFSFLSLSLSSLALWPCLVFLLCDFAFILNININVCYILFTSHFISCSL